MIMMMMGACQHRHIYSGLSHFGALPTTSVCSEVPGCALTGCQKWAIKHFFFSTDLALLTTDDDHHQVSIRPLLTTNSFCSQLGGQYRQSVSQDDLQKETGHGTVAD